MKRLLTVLLFLTLGRTVLCAQDACPNGLPPTVTCYSGVDENGAYFLIAVPENYNNRLVLYNHGYDLDPPGPITYSGEQIRGYVVALMVQGYAVAASSYRPDAIGLGGWAVADGAQDTENLRQRFIEMFGSPELTFVTGHSEGGLVSAEIAELFGTDRKGFPNYHGSLPMCGPLAGGRRNCDGAFDLRVVYQYYCQNLPRPDEPQYPLYLGLDHVMTEDELLARVNQCTGILVPPDHRTEAQQQNLSNILNVIRIPESYFLRGMSFVTYGFQELAGVRARGRSPVTNRDVIYDGSSDDDALNAGVFRAGSDPEARAWLSRAYDPTGAVFMPTLTLHTIGDGASVVENEQAYRETLESAGTAGNLLQMFTNSSEHCDFSTSEFMAAFQSLASWVESGQRPEPAEVIDRCEQHRKALGDTCDFNEHFEPNTFDSRVRPREP